MSQPPQQKASTLHNLKTAAAGIHGAGETLRGTLNQTVDKRFAKPNATVHEKNQATLDAGRTEIETGRFAHHQSAPLHAGPPPPPKDMPYGPGYENMGYSAHVSSGGTPVGQSAGQGNGKGRLGSFVQKMKEGPMNSQKGNNLHVVNE
ncbi:hypothetical protein EJ04DRAFT_510393 [Polyplosphaeria fusca]|uniref:Uncharacterized protein n=1 Tax=Polyplosphaeria fusca TaxID=682080 RepID=A0A9P4R5P5_9PLEO|nr:hypothetical protein EJ04DRAFT_510393 [Polyplosphaeria fusca]